MRVYQSNESITALARRFATRTALERAVASDASYRMAGESRRACVSRLWTLISAAQRENEFRQARRRARRAKNAGLRSGRFTVQPRLTSCCGCVRSPCCARFAARAGFGY